MKRKELDEILENHTHWMKRDCDGWENMRADFSSADLSYTDLSYADLRYANFSSADLSYTDLRFANLHSTDLHSANFSSADLSYANLRSAILSFANLSYADLSFANLSYADLRYANFSSADLSYTDLSYADFNRTYLSSAKNIPYIPMACPEEGEFIGWKKCRDNKIVKLLIPEDARRSSAMGRKCRCDKAKVIGIFEVGGSTSETTQAVSKYDDKFIYRIGDIVSVPNFCDNRFSECGTGIHFFINRKEAENYKI